MTEYMPIIEPVALGLSFLGVFLATAKAIAQWDRWSLIQLVAVVAWAGLLYFVLLPDLRTL